MRATRLTQPYRRGARAPGAALSAMTKGRSAGGFNPADATRAGYLIRAGGSKRSRPQRPPRPARPKRPQR